MQGRQRRGRRHQAGGAACDLKIGFFGALTGDAAGLGIHMRNGTKLAIDQYNKANADCKVELKEYDSQGDPAKAPALAQAGGRRHQGRRDHRPGVLG